MAAVAIQKRRSEAGRGSAAGFCGVAGLGDGLSRIASGRGIRLLARGEDGCEGYAGEHGEDYWRKLIVMNGEAWLRIADEAVQAAQDIYDDRLAELAVPTLFLHGSRDPRTEPGEMEAVRDQLPNARIEFIEGGGHSPHSESASAGECNRIVTEFLESIS